MIANAKKEDIRQAKLRGERNIKKTLKNDKREED